MRRRVSAAGRHSCGMVGYNSGRQCDRRAGGGWSYLTGPPLKITSAVPLSTARPQRFGPSAPPSSAAGVPAPVAAIPSPPVGAAASGTLRQLATAQRPWWSPEALHWSSTTGNWWVMSPQSWRLREQRAWATLPRLQATSARQQRPRQVRPPAPNNPRPLAASPATPWRHAAPAAVLMPRVTPEE